MYNVSPYNSQAYNVSPIPVQITQDSIVFNGYSLQNSNIITSRIDYDNQGGVELNSFNFPNIDGGGVLSKYYRGRTITLSCTIKSDTRSNFEALLDTTKKALRQTEGYLEINVSGEIRKIKATLTKFVLDRQHYNINFGNVLIEFTSVEPFFYASEKQTSEFLGQTSSFFGEIDNQGSVETMPVFYFVGSAGCNLTALDVVYQGKSLTITTAIIENDVIIIDAETMTVSKNGTEINYTGYFPVFSTGSCTFQVICTGTTALDLTIVANKNYL